MSVQGLTDEHIFMEAQPIVSSLFMRDCGPALAWCQANKAKLKKGKSKLEFKLRTQVVPPPSTHFFMKAVIVIFSFRRGGWWLCYLMIYPHATLPVVAFYAYYVPTTTSSRKARRGVASRLSLAKGRCID
jgi:hypothetical protein